MMSAQMEATATCLVLIAFGLPTGARAQDLTPGAAAGVAFVVTFVVCLCVCLIVVCLLLKRLRLAQRRAEISRAYRGGVENSGFDRVDRETGASAGGGGGAGGAVSRVNERSSATDTSSVVQPVGKSRISVCATKSEDLALKVKLIDNMALVSKDPLHSSLCSRLGVRSGDRIVGFHIDLTTGDAEPEAELVSFLLGLVGHFGLTVDFERRQPSTTTTTPVVPPREASRSGIVPSIVVSASTTTPASEAAEVAPESKARAAAAAPAATASEVALAAANSGTRLLLGRICGGPLHAAGDQFQRALLTSEWTEAEPSSDEWVGVSAELMVREEEDTHAYAVIGEAFAAPDLSLELTDNDAKKTWRSLPGHDLDAIELEVAMEKPVSSPNFHAASAPAAAERADKISDRRGSGSSVDTSSGTASTQVEVMAPRDLLRLRASDAADGGGDDDAQTTSGDEDFEERDAVAAAVKEADKAVSKSMVKPEFEIGANFEIANESDVKTDIEVQAEVELDVDAQAEVELDFDDQTEVELDVDAQAEVELDFDDQTEVELDVDAQVEVELDVDAQAEVEVDVDAQAEEDLEDLEFERAESILEAESEADDIEEISIDDDTPDTRSLEPSALASMQLRTETSSSSGSSRRNSSSDTDGSNRQLADAIQQAAQAVENEIEPDVVEAEEIVPLASGGQQREPRAAPAWESLDNQLVAGRRRENSDHQLVQAVRWENLENHSVPGSGWKNLDNQPVQSAAVEEPPVQVVTVQHQESRPKPSKIPQRSLSAVLKEVELATANLVESEAVAASSAHNDASIESPPAVEEDVVTVTLAPASAIQLDFQALEEQREDEVRPESPLLDSELLREIQAGAERIWDDEDGVGSESDLRLEESEGELSDSFQEFLQNEEELEGDGLSRMIQKLEESDA